MGSYEFNHFYPAGFRANTPVAGTMGLYVEQSESLGQDRSEASTTPTGLILLDKLR